MRNVHVHNYTCFVFFTIAIQQMHCTCTHVPQNNVVVFLSMVITV